MLNEASIITYLKKEFPSHMGDDAAVFPLSETQSYLITKDLLVEDVHFNLHYFDAASLAHKALHVNLSDVAAMGATPQFVLLGLAIPPAYASQLPDFLQAFAACCKKSQVVLIGGDTTASPDKLFISVTVLGSAENTQIKYRHSARANDKIYLVGSAGLAHVGLQALETACEDVQLFKQNCLKPTARLKESLWIAQQVGVHAMMDCSDGLFVDLQRLCQASRVAAEINLDYFKASHEFIAACQKLNCDPLLTQLTGGEDYGLIITVDAAHEAQIASLFASEFAYPLTPIGHIKKGSGIEFTKNGQPELLTLTPFSHFGELS